MGHDHQNPIINRIKQQINDLKAQTVKNSTTLETLLLENRQHIDILNQLDTDVNQLATTTHPPLDSSAADHV